jgi:putative membrane protein
MIVRPRPGPVQLLFVLRGTILPRVLPSVLVVTALSCAVVWAFRGGHPALPHASPAPMSLLGIALSIFLGFRNSACYDRWWEARKLWGALIFELRSFSREAVALLEDGGGPGSAAARQLVHRGVAFAHALVGQLKTVDTWADAGRFLSAEEAAAVAAADHRPNALLLAQARQLAALKRAGALSDIAWAQLAERVHGVTTVLAACERIRLTPLPFAYTVLLHRTAYLFCLLLPFGVADALGWFTPVLSALVAYTFFGLDTLAEELEEPFGDMPNDLPLLAMARTIERNLLDTLGEPLPPPLAPRDFILR